LRSSTKYWEKYSNKPEISSQKHVPQPITEDLKNSNKVDENRRTILEGSSFLNTAGEKQVLIIFFINL
jgi:hypothetical protein